MTTETKEEKKLVYNLHPGQWKVWESISRFVAMLAGTQSGKTTFGPLWLHREIQRTANSDDDYNDYIAVTANFKLYQRKMLPELLEYFVRTLGIGKFWAGAMIIELAENLEPGKFWAKNENDKMWGRIILCSAEAPAGLESATAKAAWLDEAGHPDFKRMAWEATQRRLSLYQGRVLFTTTLYDWGWLKLEVFDRWEAGDKDYEVIQFDSRMNPAFPSEEYERAKRTLPKWKFDLFYRGQYARPAGLIYDSFHPDICKLTRAVIDSKIQDNWPRFVGHDFGPVHTSALWYAQEPLTGYLYLYRTYLTQEKRTAAANTAEWIRLSGDEGIVRRIGGAGGSQAADEGWRQAYSMAGWPISEPLTSSVEVGIDKVYAWHKTDRLFIPDDEFEYLAEKQSYSRELDDNYNPTDKIKNKSLYHYMDGERYVLGEFQPVDVVKKESNRPTIFVPRGR